MEVGLGLEAHVALGVEARAAVLRLADGADAQLIGGVVLGSCR
jgi:hypothetical protein